MIKIDEKSKKLLEEHIGPDGKFIIDDSLPENIRQAFEFFNSNDDIDIRSYIEAGSVDLNTQLEEPEEIEEDDDEQISDDGIIIDDATVIEEPSSDIETVEPKPMSEAEQAEISKNLEDLNDMFN